MITERATLAPRTGNGASAEMRDLLRVLCGFVILSLITLLARLL